MSGDQYIREIAGYIRANERGLAESSWPRRRTVQPAQQRPVLLRTDTHHLFFLFIRLEALGLPVGELDVHIDAPSRPMSYIHIPPAAPPNTDALSFTSLRSSLSVVSSFSLGASWWSRPDPPNIDAELKYIYSSFTKLPALCIGPPGPKVITELVQDPQGQNAVPLDAFKNLQQLECEDIDPRTLLGWDRLAESLRSLKLRNTGLQDITQVFIGAVLDDHARRQGSPSRKRHRNIPSSLPEDVFPLDPDPTPVEGSTSPFETHKLSPLKWAFLKHLHLPDNGLTFFPSELIPHLKAVTHLDLSSNLLVSVPGLAELYNLASLNLSDNLIDSVLGIYQNLGQVLTLHLSRNRLESLCGLERLLALERVDFRHNLLDESSEIGRLAVLPNITEIWVQGNPFVDIEEGYRITCFDYFWKEGKHISLDGTAPNMYERRNLSIQPEKPSPLPPFVSSSAPVIAVEHSRHHSTVAPPSPSPQPSPHLSPSSAPGPKRKKTKRIVEFNEDHSNQSSRSHSRMQSVDHHGKAPVAEVDKSPLHRPTSASYSDSETPEEPPRPRARHSRSHTEYAQSAGSVSQRTQTLFPRLSGTASRSELRRGRVSTSVFEPPGSRQQGDDNPETYRKKIELLKRDMGDSWLKVYNQSQP